MKRRDDLIEKLQDQNYKLSSERDSLIKRLIQLEEEIKKMEKLAMISPVAGIYNLNFVNTEVERIKAIKERELAKLPAGTKPEPEYVFMFFIDIDGLKAINDVHGHAIGNNIIRKLASVLESVVRRCDIAAHLHGDEFVVIAMSKDRNEGKNFKKRINEATHSIFLEEYGIAFGASAGFQSTILNPKFSFRKLMDKADAKMYRRKEERKKKEQ